MSQYRHHQVTENGMSSIIEATVVMPVALVMILALYFAAIWMAQKASLQEALQETLIYYKNQESDTYVTAKSRMARGSVSKGSDINVSGKLSPYRLFTTKFNESDFRSFFLENYGNQFFDGSGVEVHATCSNYLIYKEIHAYAVRNVSPPFSFKIAGVDLTEKNVIPIQASASIVVSDGDDFTRNTDLILDVINDTELGQNFQTVINKVADLYQRFKDAIGA